MTRHYGLEFMLSRTSKVLEFFLPETYRESLEAPLLYRAKLIIATNLVGVLVCIALLVSIFELNYSLPVFACVTAAAIVSIYMLYRVKVVKENVDENLTLTGTVQVLSISALVYISAFSPKGIGFFGLFWLIPQFLTMAFLFNFYYSLVFGAINLAIFIGITLWKFGNLLDPIKFYPVEFSYLYYASLILLLGYSFFYALSFVHFSSELQKEVIKQRDILVQSAKFQSLGQMASNLAHDINNPLFSIQGKLHQMRNLLSKDQLDLNKCDQIVENIEGTILKLSQIAKGISTFARQGYGDQMSSIYVSELVEGNVAIAIDRIRKSGIKLELDLPDSLELICYPSFISQVLLNLLNNAIDALETSSIKLIRVRVYAEMDWINIVVSDTGPGVPKGFEEKIFDQFFTTKKIGKGSGLGLSISKGLVEVHDGMIMYQRSEGVTSFIVRLPLYSEFTDLA